MNAAVAAGKIPDIPPTKDTGGNPEYAKGLDPMSDEICSTTWKCRKNPERPRILGLTASPAFGGNVAKAIM